ncbi:MAG: SDR family oxidoreductase [Thiolinea sp.]
MDLQIKDKVAVVTGGSSGIGLATVKLLLKEGTKVAFCGRDVERLNTAKQALQQEFPQAQLFAHPCDVMDSTQTQAFAAAVQAELGQVDILINNAGQGRVSTFATTTDEAWREELDLKLFGVIYPTRAFLPLLQASPIASIVCVNSLLALQPEPHMVATSAARAALLSLVHSLATELIPIRVNSILLGLVESGQWRRRYQQRTDPNQTWEAWSAELASQKHIPLGRLGRTEEPAQAIVFLASPLASYTTGTHLDISGGLARHV